MQTRGVVPGARALAGVLTFSADIEAQRAGLNALRHGRERRAQLLRQRPGLLRAPLQPAQNQRKDVLQPRQGEYLRQLAVGHVGQFKAAALQRAQEVFGIHLVHDRAQLRPEPVKFLRPVFTGQAEDPFQIGAVHRPAVLNLPGQQVAGDVEQRVQGRKRGQPVLSVQEGIPGMVQHEAQFVPGNRGGAEGLAENDMPVQLPDSGLRIGDQLKISVAGGGRFQSVIKEAFGQGVDRGIFPTGAHFQRLDQLFVKTQVKLAEHHQSFHVCFVLNANLAFYYQLFISLLISCNCDVS